MALSLTHLIQKQMEFVANNNSWHASLIELLESVTPEEAVWRPEGGGHTIYELAVHLAYSVEEATSRLQGNTPQWIEEQSWVQSPQPLTADEWESAKARVVQSRQKLAETVADMGDSRLEAPREGNKPPFMELVLQIIHHDAFHAGQIALLRRQQGKAALM
ncbi:DinB family protein [Paenibacillus thermotolerans]|uniref:DinB family protein n=1 Tax=Paenibacillus thermotolerans TaxID=3027807 RepID=UPI0023676DD1|nr:MULTISPECIES: DinB family protein [unclassified Paenibacillus]